MALMIVESLGPRHSGRVAAAQQLRGVGSLDVIHRQPQLALVLAAVVDADDVRMPQLGGEVRFAAETLPELEVRGQRGRQDLEGVAAGESRVLCQVDLTHAT